MNKSREPTGESGGEVEEEDGRIRVELTEAECVIIQHALLVVHTWDRKDGDEGLASRHNDLRNTMIDAHEEWLREQGVGRHG